MAAISAEADPPPGAGEREPERLARSRARSWTPAARRALSPIMYSMMRLSGSNGVIDDSPSRSTASRIFCRSSTMNRLSFSM